MNRLSRRTAKMPDHDQGRGSHDPSMPSLERWDDEGGAEPDGPQLAAPERLSTLAAAGPGAGDWAEMRTRVIALENLVIALLAAAPGEQRAMARRMADHIAPRPNATPHRLTIHASHRMADLLVRAERFEANP
jgi:hypothetical protein